MDENFKLRANLKSDEELHACIDNREKFLPETVEAAVAELQYRGVTFSDDELRVITEDMQARRDLAREGTDSFSMFSNREKDNQVDDPEAPAYFSKRVILIFSVLFSVFFASILLAVNLNRTAHKDKVALAVLFGLGFTIAVGLLAPTFHYNAFFTILTGFSGAYLMEVLFWNKYIGNSTLYKVRPVWIPLIIVLAIYIPLGVFLYYNKNLLDFRLLK
jgi:lipopolysaccharide export LptBFGC system permease protein LptF